MNEKTKIKTYKISYSDGRSDEIFELEEESDCDHHFIPLGGVPSLPFGEDTMTRGGCIQCSNTLLKQENKNGEHVAFYKKAMAGNEKN